MQNHIKFSHIPLSPCCCYLVSLANVSLLQNEYLKASMSSGKLEMSIILISATENVMVSQKNCRPNILFLARIWQGNGHFTTLFIYLLWIFFVVVATSGCSTSPVDLNIFVQKVKWLYVLVMSSTRFRVNLDSIAASMSRKSLLKTDAISEV